MGRLQTTNLSFKQLLQVHNMPTTKTRNWRPPSAAKQTVVPVESKQDIFDEFAIKRNVSEYLIRFQPLGLESFHSNKRYPPKTWECWIKASALCFAIKQHILSNVGISLKSDWQCKVHCDPLIDAGHTTKKLTALNEAKNSMDIKTILAEIFGVRTYNKVVKSQQDVLRGCKLRGNSSRNQSGINAFCEVPLPTMSKYAASVKPFLFYYSCVYKPA